MSNLSLWPNPSFTSEILYFRTKIEIRLLAKFGFPVSRIVTCESVNVIYLLSAACPCPYENPIDSNAVSSLSLGRPVRWNPVAGICHLHWRNGPDRRRTGAAFAIFCRGLQLHGTGSGELTGVHFEQPPVLPRLRRLQCPRWWTGQPGAGCPGRALQPGRSRSVNY